MKKQVLLALLFSFVAFTSKAQIISVLFVNDNDAFAYETDTVLSALGKTTYMFDYFNAVDSLDGPTAAVMSNYALVIWYTGVDGSSLNFWNQLDEDDADIVSYLSGGGNMWIMGTDLLYDRYGIAPYTFTAGEMFHDLCGAASYDSQSYADDGNAGCPVLVLNTTLPLVGPDTLNWIYPTTWYIDGVTPVAGAETVYEMGTSPYTLTGAVSGFYYENTTTNSHVMSELFNPAEISQAGDRIVSFFQMHLDFWAGAISSGTADPAAAKGLTAWPNPSAGLVHLPQQLHYQLTDITGRVLEQNTAIEVDLSSRPAGLYFLTDLETGNHVRLVRQ